MIWVATMKDGSVIRQYEKFSSSAELDKSKVVKFKVTETSGDTVAQFSSDSGVIKFANLDYQKLMDLNGGEKLVFVYDKESETFKLGEKSRELMSDLILNDERDYFYMELDQTGQFYISGQPFYMGFVTHDDVDIPFVNQPPYNDFKYIVTNNEDFFMNSGSPTKKLNYVTSYALGYEKEHVHELVTFKISHNIIFDVMKGCVLLNTIISADQHMNGNLYIVFGGQRMANPIEFYPGEQKFIPKMLTLV
jgi:hypothetical protein